MNYSQFLLMCLSKENIESDKNKFCRKMSTYKALKKLFTFFIREISWCNEGTCEQKHDQNFFRKKCLRWKSPILIFSCLFPLLMKIYIARFEDIMANSTQNTTKKQFLRQLTVPPNEQILFRNRYANRKYFTSFLTKSACYKK